MSAPTTPDPIYLSPNTLTVEPANDVPRMPYPERARYRLAANRARNVYPGPVGELVSRELLTMEEFGWALGAQSLGSRLVKAILNTQTAATTAQQSAVRGIVPSA